MTLLVALASKDYALLLADRRVTAAGSTVDDEFNKVCVLFCDDARVAIGFTGLATYETFNTSDWLVDELSNIGDSSGELLDILTELGRRAEVKLASLSAHYKRLGLLAVGFVYWEAAPRPTAYVLSNFGQGNKFSLRVVPCTSGALVEVAGTTDQLPVKAEQSLRHLLSSNLPASHALRCAVRHLRHTASQGTSSGLIGSQCNSAIVPAAPNTTIVTTYHSSFHSYVAYGPNVVVTQGMRVYGTELFSGTVIAGAEIRKQDPCWCGSGMKFKHCHLKKFGSFYVKHPLFNRPLYAVSQLELSVERPSGRFCNVASGYE